MEGEKQHSAIERDREGNSIHELSKCIGHECWAASHETIILPRSQEQAIGVPNHCQLSEVQAIRGQWANTNQLSRDVVVTCQEISSQPSEVSRGLGSRNGEAFANNLASHDGEGWQTGSS